MQKIKLDIQLFASGTITDGSSPSAGDVRITWTSSVNSTNNTSSLTANVQIRRASSGTTTGTFSGSLVINGVSYSISKYGSWTTSWTTVGSKTVTITHNEDGSKSININTTLTQTGTSMAGTYKASGTAVLDTINRASKLSAIEDFNINDTIELEITKYIGEATDNLTISIGDTIIRSASNISDGYSITFSSVEQATITSLMTSPQIEVTFTLTTINDGISLGTSVQNAMVTSLTQPIFWNIIKKSNGHYQVAFNGIVDETADDPLQVYNDNGDRIFYKNIFTANAKSKTLSSTNYELIPIEELSSVGDKLTLNSTSNSIVIGDGVSKVLVSASILFSTGGTSSTRRGISIYKNGSQIMYNSIKGDTTYTGASITPYLLSVQKNDYIQIYGINQGSTGSVISTANTFLTVEVVK